jgi:hypothetical protein
VSFTFETDVVHWRGPSPYVFAPVPTPVADTIRQRARELSYGWGMIPVEATLAGITFTTSLFPKDGAFLLPLKDAVRHAVNVTVGDRITVVLTLRAPRHMP